jgi:hypothetical protein
MKVWLDYYELKTIERVMSPEQGTNAKCFLSSWEVYEMHYRILGCRYRWRTLLDCMQQCGDWARRDPHNWGRQLSSEPAASA